MADGEGNKTFERWRFVQATALGRLMLPSLVAQASDGRQRILSSILISVLGTLLSPHALCWQRFPSTSRHTIQHDTATLFGLSLVVILCFCYSTQISWFPRHIREKLYEGTNIILVLLRRPISSSKFGLSIVLSGRSCPPSFPISLLVSELSRV